MTLLSDLHCTRARLIEVREVRGVTAFKCPYSIVLNLINPARYLISISDKRYTKRTHQEGPLSENVSPRVQRLYPSLGLGT